MNDVTLLPNQEIRVVFPLRGIRLVPGVDGSGGLPMEAHTALYAVDDRNTPAPIRRPEDLAPFVAAVNTAEQAEDFVRLFTRRDTHYLFQRGDFVVDVTVLALGDPPVLGGVAADVAATVGARPPLVTTDGEAFVLERDVLHFPADSQAPVAWVRRRERVARDGTYRLLGDEPVRELERELTIAPTYE